MMMMGNVLHVLRWQILAEKHAKRWRPATAASSLTSIHLVSDSGPLPRNWHKWYSGLLFDSFGLLPRPLRRQFRLGRPT